MYVGGWAFGFSCGCIGLLLGWGVDGLHVLWVLVYDALCVGGGWLRGLVLSGIVLCVVIGFACVLGLGVVLGGFGRV